MQIIKALEEHSPGGTNTRSASVCSELAVLSCVRRTRPPHIANRGKARGASPRVFQHLNTCPRDGAVGVLTIPLVLTPPRVLASVEHGTYTHAPPTSSVLIELYGLYVTRRNKFPQRTKGSLTRCHTGEERPEVRGRCRYLRCVARRRMASAAAFLVGTSSALWTRSSKRGSKSSYTRRYLKQQSFCLQCFHQHLPKEALNISQGICDQNSPPHGSAASSPPEASINACLRVRADGQRHSSLGAPSWCPVEQHLLPLWKHLRSICLISKTTFSLDKKTRDPDYRVRNYTRMC